MKRILLGIVLSVIAACGGTPKKNDGIITTPNAPECPPDAAK